MELQKSGQGAGEWHSTARSTVPLNTMFAAGWEPVTAKVAKWCPAADGHSVLEAVQYAAIAMEREAKQARIKKVDLGRALARWARKARNRIRTLAQRAVREETSLEFGLAIGAMERWTPAFDGPDEPDERELDRVRRLDWAGDMLEDGEDTVYWALKSLWAEPCGAAGADDVMLTRRERLALFSHSPQEIRHLVLETCRSFKNHRWLPALDAAAVADRTQTERVYPRGMKAATARGCIRRARRAILTALRALLAAPQ